MHKSALLRIAAMVALGSSASFVLAQDRPAKPSADRTDDAKASPETAATEKYANSALVTRMMAFDKNGDGRISQDELTDSRMQRLFNRADADKDGVVTKQELIALAATLEKEAGTGGGPRDGAGGPREGGPRDGATPREGASRDGAPREGGPRDGAPRDGAPRDGAPREGGPRDGGPRGQPGQLLPAGLQEVLNLSNDQKKQVADLQKEVDCKLGLILSEDQMKQLKEMQERRGNVRGRGDGQGRPEGQRPAGGDAQARPQGARAPSGDQPQRPKGE